MRPFNQFTRGVLMEAAPGAAGGGGDPAILPPAPAGAAPQPDEATRRMQAQLEATRQQVATLQRQVMAQPAPPQGGGYDKKALEREFIQNPLDMSAAIAQRTVQEAMQQFGAQGYDTQVEMARSLARNSDQAFFDRYQAEIEGTVAQVAPNLRINSTVWKNALQMVKGQHADEMIAAARATPSGDGAEGGNRSPAVHVKAGSGPAAPSKAAPQAAATKLSEEEAKFAKRFKMDHAQYLKGKEENLAQSDFIMDPLGKSSWDKYVTFDSRDKRRSDREKRLAATGKK